MSSTATMRALIVQADKSVKVQDHPKPTPKANEVLIRIITIGQNPTDWKHARLFTSPGAIIGCDFAGVVEELGSDVPKDRVAVGQHRSSFVRGGISNKIGAFAEYICQQWDLTMELSSKLSFEDTASWPIPCGTAVQGLFLRLGLPWPEEDSTAVHGKTILVYSGATSVGQYVIQLAKIIGLRVAATASKGNWDNLRSLGADFLVDYKDADWPEQVKKETGGVSYAFDTFSEGDSTKKCQQAFAPEGGAVVVLLPRQESEIDASSNVKVIKTLAYTTLGEDQSFGPVKFPTSAEDRATFVRWCTSAGPKLFESGKLKFLPIKKMGGLEDVDTGFTMMQEGRVKAEKLVYNVGKP